MPSVPSKPATRVLSGKALDLTMKKSSIAVVLRADAVCQGAASRAESISQGWKKGNEGWMQQAGCSALGIGRLDLDEPAGVAADLGGLPGRAEDVGPRQVRVQEVGPLERRVREDR